MLLISFYILIFYAPLSKRYLQFAIFTDVFNLTLLFQLFPFDPPVNIEKPKFPDVSWGLKENIKKKSNNHRKWSVLDFSMSATKNSKQRLVLCSS